MEEIEVERLRRTMLYVPGSSEKMINKSTTLEVDSLIIDLEDAVAITEKENARSLVAEMLLKVDFGEKEKNVRINSLETPFGEEDIRTIVPSKPDGIIIPKVNCAEDVRKVERIVEEVEKSTTVEVGSINLMAMIETPQGIANIDEIASSSKRMKALLFGAADYTKETRGRITQERLEAIYPLNRILIAARCAGIDAIDSPYFNVRDEEGLVKHTQFVVNMGYDGKSVIHPGQIAPVNKLFSPTEEEIAFAKKIIDAYEKAKAEGKGAIEVDGELVEQLHVDNAKRVLLKAEKAGLL
ncbi:MAG: CoA ester lyase [Candidatus Schekmanbacteria bacterium]|nr:MAG: CoA ester lyase [Candidatus Schekmanbacteria bacterium]